MLLNCNVTGFKILRPKGVVNHAPRTPYKESVTVILRRKEGASMADGLTWKARRALGGHWRVVLAAGLLTLAAPSLGLERLQVAQSVPAMQGRPVALIAAIRAELQSVGELTRLTFDLTGPVAPQAHVLGDPDRVVVDLPEVDFQINAGQGLPPAVRRKPAKGAEPLGGVVASYRFGLVAAGKSRVVIHLASPARIVRVVCEPAVAGGGARLVIELGRVEPALFRAEVERSRVERLAASPLPAVVAPQAAGLGQAAPLPVVALDAGHGGVDTGAHSASGALEKDIVFDFTRALAARLEAGKKVRVVLSRESDVFVALGERVRRARANGASLFVSIHADTLSEDRSVAGATVYTASDKASDAEAARVAEKENQADLAGGLDGREDQGDVSDILVDLTRRETRAYSNVFARTLVGYWKDVGQLNKNPIRSAGFQVLRAHDVPSVLLELGYLSSERDLATLTTPQWREKAANGVARAIEGFFNSRSGGESAKTATDVDPFGALAAPRGSPSGTSLRP